MLKMEYLKNEVLKDFCLCKSICMAMALPTLKGLLTIANGTVSKNNQQRGF